MRSPRDSGLTSVFQSDTLRPGVWPHLDHGRLRAVSSFFSSPAVLIRHPPPQDFVLFDVWPYFDQVYVSSSRTRTRAAHAHNQRLFARSVTNIFLYRFMLNLRGVYLAADASGRASTSGAESGAGAGPGAGAASSPLRFVTSAVGNLGAPLSVSSFVHGRSPSYWSSAGAIYEGRQTGAAGYADAGADRTERAAAVGEERATGERGGHDDDAWSDAEEEPLEASDDPLRAGLSWDVGAAAAGVTEFPSEPQTARGHEGVGGSLIEVQSAVRTAVVDV